MFSSVKIREDTVDRVHKEDRPGGNHQSWASCNLKQHKATELGLVE